MTVIVVRAISLLMSIRIGELTILWKRKEFETLTTLVAALVTMMTSMFIMLRQALRLLCVLYSDPNASIRPYLGVRSKGNCSVLRLISSSCFVRYLPLCRVEPSCRRPGFRVPFRRC